MSNDEFSQAASTTGIQWSELSGRLLVIEPHQLEKEVQTSLGAKDAVRADVHVIDGEDPKSYNDALIFPRVLISQTKTKIGQRVLGRLGQGNAKPGQNAPWLLDQNPTDADYAAAAAWLKNQNAFVAPSADEPPF